MNHWNYIPLIKLEGQSTGIFFDIHSCFVRTALQSGKDAVNYFTSCEVRTWRILAKAITAICATSHSGSNIQRVGGSDGAITDNSQSTKDINTYLKSQLNMQHPDHQEILFILPNGLTNSVSIQQMNCCCCGLNVNTSLILSVSQNILLA